jgi:hypothetical protein
MIVRSACCYVLKRLRPRKKQKSVLREKPKRQPPPRPSKLCRISRKLKEMLRKTGKGRKMSSDARGLRPYLMMMTICFEVSISTSLTANGTPRREVVPVGVVVKATLVGTNNSYSPVKSAITLTTSPAPSLPESNTRNPVRSDGLAWDAYELHQQIGN